MFDGTLKNTFVGNRPLARLSLGITGADGKRAEIQFVRDDATGDLVAQLDEAEAQPAPTDSEINEMYLMENEWEKQMLGGVGQVWEDPIGGGAYLFENALALQELRDRQDEMTETEILCARCQQPIAPDADYEFALFPPIAASDTGERIYRYHPQCFTGDRAEQAELHAVAFDPNYISVGEWEEQPC